MSDTLPYRLHWNDTLPYDTLPYVLYCCHATFRFFSDNCLTYITWYKVSFGDNFSWSTCSNNLVTQIRQEDIFLRSWKVLPIASNNTLSDTLPYYLHWYDTLPYDTLPYHLHWCDTLPYDTLPYVLYDWPPLIYFVHTISCSISRGFK